MTGAVTFALLPILILIAFGHVLRRRAFLADAFWPQAERLSYFILLPALFIHGLATADLGALPAADLAATLIVAIVAVSGAVIAARPWLAHDGPGFTSIFQGAVRFNNYVGVTLAAGLFGAEGVALAAICNAAIVPTVNVLCVLVFARHGKSRLDWRGVARQIATNPLLVSCVIGIIFQISGVKVPPGLDAAMKALGAASLPLGLLCVGAALEFHATGRWTKPVVLSSAVKFGLMPLATFVAAKLFGLQGAALTSALLFQSLPTASSSYIMARQLGGDAPLMAAITAIQTVLAFATIPLVMAALDWLR